MLLRGAYRRFKMNRLIILIVTSSIEYTNNEE
ncbi:hypothetical protein VPHK469_0229 [Vibrio phage K469]